MGRKGVLWCIKISTMPYILFFVLLWLNRFYGQKCYATNYLSKGSIKK